METTQKSKSHKRIIVRVVVVLVVLFCVASFVADRVILNQLYQRFDARPGSILPTYEAYESDYPRVDYTFELDGKTLVGHLYGPDNTRGLIVFRHGITSQHQDYLGLIMALVDNGWRIFAYDAIGCGESEGDNVRGLSQSPIDVAAAVQFVRDEGLVGDGPLALWGHSWGGYGVAAALAKVDGVDACITMSGFDTPMKVMSASATNMMGPLGITQYPFLYLNTLIDFGGDANVSASDAVANSGVPTLVIHGYGDTTVPYEGVSILDALAHRWQGMAGSPVGLTTKAEPGRNGHNNYFYSYESQAYFDECWAEISALIEANNGDASAQAVQDYIATVDIRRANTADPYLIDEIESFLTVYCE